MERFFAPVPLAFSSLAIAMLGVGLQLGGVQSPILSYICYVVAFFLFAGFVISVVRPRPAADTQQRLDDYFARMEQWLDGPDAPLSKSPPDERIRVSAQERTIGILPGLSPDGKRRVMRFLHRHELIKVGTAIISLANADLSRANLSGLRLAGALLVKANFRNADLSDAGLCDYQAIGVDFQRMIERGTPQRNLSQPINVSHLTWSDLSGAVLRRAHLGGCIFQSADFAGADLDEADLRAADLRRARNLTQEQVEKAYGSKGQEDVSDTLLPGNLKAPELWKWSLSQQQAMRQSKS
jgi:hypothetical protein